MEKIDGNNNIAYLLNQQNDGKIRGMPMSNMLIWLVVSFFLLFLGFVHLHKKAL
jgi:hypothetical protein